MPGGGVDGGTGVGDGGIGVGGGVGVGENSGPTGQQQPAPASAHDTTRMTESMTRMPRPYRVPGRRTNDSSSVSGTNAISHQVNPIPLIAFGRAMKSP